MCSVIAGNVQCYALAMQPEQRIIANWLMDIAHRKGWNWATWAERAGIGAPTTISRAVKDDYGSVTKIETLHKLARAANVPSVLDFLQGDAVNVSAVKALLTELLPLAPKRRWSAQDVEILVEALAYGLQLPPSDPTNPASQDAYGVAARAAAERFRDLTSEA